MSQDQTEIPLDGVVLVMRATFLSLGAGALGAAHVPGLGPWLLPISILRSPRFSVPIIFRVSLATNGHAESGSDAAGGAGRFPPTHWSQVVEAGRGDSSTAREAFGGLYRAYRAPLLGFLRSQGQSEPEAQDLLQGFFEYLLSRQGLAQVEPTGKFRSWLLASIKNFRSDAWDKARAQKRGGGQRPLTLQTEDEEQGVDPRHPGRTPDEEFDRQFALCFLARVKERLEGEYRLGGRHDLFAALQPYLLEKKGGASHTELGRRLHMSEAAVAKAISRLRERYRATFNEELANLVGVAGDLEEERRFLFQALTK